MGITLRRLAPIALLVCCLLPATGTGAHGTAAHPTRPPWPDSTLRRTGQVAVPVLLVRFQGSSDPFTANQLRNHLFADTGGSRTLTDYYREVSYGKLALQGDVFGWFALPEDHAYYEDGCSGICEKAYPKITSLIETAVSGAQQAGVDFARYDNDGPDGQPDSGDDDGFVDLLLLVYSDRANGCDLGGGATSRGINPHHQRTWNLGNDFVRTGSRGHGGREILVDELVISAGQDCALGGINPIGDLAHEIGHGLGLPDLVDQDYSSAGIGAWSLMAEGGAGGDLQSPESPTHLSAWAKMELGWLVPREVSTPGPLRLRPVEEHADAILIPIEPMRWHQQGRPRSEQFYLLEVRQRSGFDRSLPGEGLLVWRIDGKVVEEWRAAWRDNAYSASVNDEDTRKGVVLIEASENDPGAADAGDPFPGAYRVEKFDGTLTSTPRSFGGIALCRIREVGDEVHLDLELNGECP